MAEDILAQKAEVTWDLGPPGNIDDDLTEIYADVIKAHDDDVTVIYADVKNG